MRFVNRADVDRKHSVHPTIVFQWPCVFKEGGEKKSKRDDSLCLSKIMCM